jgi:hypothetical protein
VKIITATIKNEVNESFLLRQGGKPELQRGDIGLHFRQKCKAGSGLEPQLLKVQAFLDSVVAERVLPNDKQKYY